MLEVGVAHPGEPRRKVEVRDRITGPGVVVLIFEGCQGGLKFLPSAGVLKDHRVTEEPVVVGAPGVLVPPF
jgi:hypothetical protein